MSNVATLLTWVPRCPRCQALHPGVFHLDASTEAPGARRPADQGPTAHWGRRVACPCCGAEQRIGEETMWTRLL